MNFVHNLLCFIIRSERAQRRSVLRKSIEDSIIQSSKLVTVSSTSYGRSANRFGDIKDILGEAKSLVTDLHKKLSACTPEKSGNVKKEVRTMDTYEGFECASAGHKPLRPSKRQEVATAASTITITENTRQESSSTNESDLNLQCAQKLLEEFEQEQIPKYKAAYLRMRYIVPIDVSKLSIDDLCRKGLPRPVSKRIWSQKTLWFLVMHTDDISKVHIADLRAKFQFKDLDIVEMRAVWYCLVDIWCGSCPKAEWKEDFKRKLNLYSHMESQRTLPEKLMRHPAYASAEPIELFDPFISVSTKYTADYCSPEQENLKAQSSLLSYSDLDDIDFGILSRNEQITSGDESPTISDIDIDIDLSECLTYDNPVSPVSLCSPYKISLEHRSCSPELKPRTPPSKQKKQSPQKKAIQITNEPLVKPMQPLPTQEDVKQMLISEPSALSYYFMGRLEYPMSDFDGVFDTLQANNWLLECMSHSKTLTDPLESLRALIGEMDADVNIIDSLGRSPLRLWITNEEIGRYLVLMGADIFHTTDNENVSILQISLNRRYYWLLDAISGTTNESNIVKDQQKLLKYVEALVVSGRPEQAAMFISFDGEDVVGKLTISPTAASDMMTTMSEVLMRGTEGLRDPIGTYELLTRLGAVVEL